MRIDKYLKVCRLIKRRTVANEACDSERITINGKTAKPSKEVKIGDIITITYGNRSITVRVLAVADAVKKEDAAALYEIVHEN